MHTFNGNSCIIHYNSDFSGNVEIVTGVKGDNRVQVSGKDLLDFIAIHVRDKMISQLENASTKDILGI